MIDQEFQEVVRFAKRILVARMHAALNGLWSNPDIDQSVFEGINHEAEAKEAFNAAEAFFKEATAREKLGTNKKTSRHR